jgi:hypothetical protein
MDDLAVLNTGSRHEGWWVVQPCGSKSKTATATSATATAGYL